MRKLYTFNTKIHFNKDQHAIDAMTANRSTTEFIRNKSKFKQKREPYIKHLLETGNYKRKELEALSTDELAKMCHGSDMANDPVSAMTGNTLKQAILRRQS